MPLVGVIDPTHDERANDEPGRYPRWVPKDQLLAEAAVATPKWSPWPYELLSAAIGHDGDRETISVTQVTGACTRSKVIGLFEDYVDRIDSHYAALRGTWTHNTFEEHTRPNAIAEWRFYTDVYLPGIGRTVTLSGSPDLVSFGVNPTILDWKVTENPPTFGYPYKGHSRQLQWLRYLINNAENWKDNSKPRREGIDANIPFNPRELTFEHLAIVYVGPKGPKVIEVERAVEVRTPNNKVIKRKQPYIQTDDEVEKELFPRLEALVIAREAYREHGGKVWPEGLEKMPGFEGPPSWACPGPPLCYLPDCLAKRWPNGLIWESP